MSFNQMMMGGRPLVRQNITISSDAVNWNLITDGFGGSAPTTVAAVVITVNSGINVRTMNLTGLPDGSTIRLVNLGNIYGAGGNGGNGENVWSEDDR